MDISLSCTLSQSLSTPPQQTLHLVQLYKHKIFLTSGFYSPTTPHTTYPTCISYSIQVDNFLRFNCLWTNLDVSIHCIVSYYTVSIILLLSAPFLVSPVLHCKLSVVRKSLLSTISNPEMNYIFWANTRLPFQLVPRSNHELHFPSTKHCESVSNTFHTLWFWTQNYPKSFFHCFTVHFDS